MTREEAVARARYIRDRHAPSSERFNGLVDAIADALLSADARAREEERAACEAIARRRTNKLPSGAEIVQGTAREVADAIAARRAQTTCDAPLLAEVDPASSTSV
jgi:hypothetical protein